MRAQPLHAMRARAEDLRAVFAIRPFAIYQAGSFAMTNGFWMQRIAVGWLMWQMTGSEAWLGVLAFAELFPSILTAILGGTLADRHPGHRVMFWGQIVSGLAPLSLTVLHMADALTPMVLIAIMAFFGATSGALLPARLSMASYLAPPPLLPSALAVNSSGFNLSRFIGPAIAAGLLAWGSATAVFVLATLTYVWFAVSLHQIRHVPRQSPARAPSPPASTLRVLRDVAMSPAIFGVILLQLAQGMLLRPASELFPAFAEIAFDRGAAGLGALNAALGLGAVIGALALSKARETDAAIRQILSMSVLFAISLIVFALTGGFHLALLVLVVHGAAMSSSNIAAQAFVQIQTSPERLGRVLSLYTIVFRVGPALGAFLFGMTAEATSLALTGIAFGTAGLAVTGLLGLWITRPRPATEAAE